MEKQEIGWWEPKMEDTAAVPAASDATPEQQPEPYTNGVHSETVADIDETASENGARREERVVVSRVGCEYVKSSMGPAFAWTGGLGGGFAAFVSASLAGPAPVSATQQPV